MAITVLYGIGGYDPSKPNGNKISEYDDGQPEPQEPDVQALAEALSALPDATLDALKQALGIG